MARMKLNIFGVTGRWSLSPSHPIRAWRCWLYRRAGLVLAVLVAIVWGLIVLVRIAAAQDCEYGAFGCGHRENHEQYQNWNARPIYRDGAQTKDGNCCDGQDCRPVRARQDENGDWRIYVPELKDWLSVPPAVVDMPDRFGDGRSHACTSKPGNHMMPVPVIYCFSPSQVKG